MSALRGSPLDTVVIGVADLEASLAFYRDVIGMTASAPVDWSGDAFAAIWHLPEGAGARAAFCHAGPDPVGRVLLVEFAAPGRLLVRENAERRSFGLFNLNFYTPDIHAAHAELSARGYEFWSAPVEHAFTPEVGTPVEVIFEGPDAVPINLVELKGGEPSSRIGEMRAFMAAFGHTAAGYSPVVTSAHCVRSRNAGVAFYGEVLGMSVIIDEELFSDEANHFLNTPAGARTHITFVQGAHMFGKVAMSMPVNYAPPDLVPRAVAPNIGYLAQAFAVADLDAAEAAFAAVRDREVYAPRQSVDVPGLGPQQVSVVRNPASGALTWLMAQA